MTIREIAPDDRATLHDILTRTGSFTPGEIDVAMELIDIGLNRAGQTDYHFRCIEDGEGRLAGYLCYGQVPLSDRCWDLYWIAVDPARQGQGLGREMIRWMETDLRERGARKILIETGGKPAYEPTRRFYLQLEYREAARIADFFAVGDDKVIFVKDLA